jgi:hypothetical protein
MATYWLTFRIHDNAGSEARRDALYDTISKLTPEWWIEPTSFIVFESDSGIDTIAARAKSAIDPRVDLVLIGMPDFKSALLVGKSGYFETLLQLVPFVKRV